LIGLAAVNAVQRLRYTLDSIHGGEAYQQVCDELLACFDDPELTFSARILRSLLQS
jgi:glutamate--cysteine ligase